MCSSLKNDMSELENCDTKGVSKPSEMSLWISLRAVTWWQFAFLEQLVSNWSTDGTWTNPESGRPLGS